MPCIICECFSIAVNCLLQESVDDVHEFVRERGFALFQRDCDELALQILTLYAKHMDDWGKAWERLQTL